MTFFLLWVVAWLLAILIVVRTVTHWIKKRNPPVTFIELERDRYPFWWE